LPILSAKHAAIKPDPWWFVLCVVGGTGAALFVAGAVFAKLLGL
jgi:hypothetical protein